MLRYKFGIFLFLSSFLLVLNVVSCGKTYDKYAVVLWTDQPDFFVNGDIAGVIAFSSIRQEYQIEKPESEKPLIKPMDSWRLRVFDSRGQAEEYIRNNKDFLQAFGSSLRQALPVRAKADRSSQIVYRLKEGEEVKILAREKEKRDEGGLNDYWYEIMTVNGTSGWVFGYQLRTDNEGSDTAGQDPLSVLASGNWRPAEYDAMIHNGVLDLAEFKPEYGFFLYPEEKKLTLNLSKDQITLDYSELKSQGKNTWKVGNSGMQIHLDPGGELTVEWVRKDKSVASCSFVNFKENVQKLFDDENSRRTGLILDLARRSKKLTSENFGNLSMRTDGSFEWTGYEALSPSVIPAMATGSGRASIRYYTGTALSAKYTGILSMDFEVPSGIEEVNFLYQIRDDGIRFEYVRKTQFKGLRLIENQSNPQIVFFNY